MNEVGEVLRVGYTVLMSGALLALGGVIWELVHRRPDPWMRGKHLSRPLIRRLGYDQTMLSRTLVCVAAMFLTYAVGQYSIGGRICFAVLGVWMIDDYLTGREKPPGRRRARAWAKSKLKKLKPPRLQPAHRWRPAPAPG